MQQTEVAVIGGGIVGLATAYTLVKRHPGLRVTVVEKERALGQHQTGHNSGVLHSGIYYRPGSLKARNCREGKRAMQEFCDAEGIPYELCGKVIVATSEAELPLLEQLHARGLQNGIRCEQIGPDRLREIEPHAAGLRAIHVPEAGIVDYGRVCQALANRIRENGGVIRTGMRVRSVARRPESVILESDGDPVEAKMAVNCGGLHSDRVARLTGAEPGVQIVPFRGEYYRLLPAARPFCRHLIYPVPDPSFPFLGVHFTRMIDGEVECGPNAVLAFAREGYRRRDVNLHDLAETLTYSGFLRLARRYWKTGAGEMWRSVSKPAFVRALQKLVPGIRESDLEPAPAGVRAQAVGPDGKMLDDFLIAETDRVVNVCNAPSPGATASLSIGRWIVERLEARL